MTTTKQSKEQHFTSDSFVYIKLCKFTNFTEEKLLKFPLVLSNGVKKSYFPPQSYVNTTLRVLASHKNKVCEAEICREKKRVTYML